MANQPPISLFFSVLDEKELDRTVQYLHRHEDTRVLDTSLHQVPLHFYPGNEG